MRQRIATRRRLVVVAIACAVAVAVVGAGLVTLDRQGDCADDVPPGEPTLATDPYVQHVTEDSAVIRWWTAEETGGTVSYGQGGELVARISVAPGESHAARLTDLESGTAYRYRVHGEGVQAAGMFRTAPGPDAAVTIGVVGDTGTGGEAQRDVAMVLAGMEPDIVLHTGDVVYRRGAFCDYDDKYFDPYEELIASVPIYPAVGNHDLLAADGAAFDQVFGLAADRPGRWFSFDYGPAHVVVLDSEIYHPTDEDAIAAQRAWLAADVSRASRPWTIVVLHRPPFSSSGDHADAQIREDLVPLFAAHDVDLVLAGHAHNYERFAPVDGVTYVVTGGGGADLHDLSPGPTTAVSAVAHHAVKVVVAPNSLSITAIDRGGQVIDQVVIEGGTLD